MRTEFIYNDGGKDYFDAVAVDTYNHPAAEGVRALTNELTNIRNVMINNEDSEKKIWITESGWSVYYNTSEIGQAKWLTDSFAALHDLDYIGPIFWYNFRNKNTGDAFEDNLGLIRGDWSLKPAYIAYQTFIQENPQ